MAYTKDLWTKRIAGRSDMSSQVIHLTHSSVIGGQKIGPVDVLLRILREQRIVGSTTDNGFICGNIPATCFQDVPLYSLSQNVYAEEQYRAVVEDAKVRYVGVGLMFPKPYVYAKGGRPVLYENTDKAKNILPEDEWWRIVRFELTDEQNFIDWTHEREWRLPGSFEFELDQATVLLPSKVGFDRFLKLCKECEDESILDRIRGIVDLGSVFF